MYRRHSGMSLTYVKSNARSRTCDGCDRKRSERRPRNIVDLAENFMQGAPLIRSLLGGGISVAGAQAFEQLDHIEQGRTSRIAAELISAPCTTHRTHEAGAAQSVHDLRQMMIGYAVFPVDLGHRQLPVGTRGKLQQGKDGEPARDLQLHGTSIPLSSIG